MKLRILLALLVIFCGGKSLTAALLPERFATAGTGSGVYLTAWEEVNTTSPVSLTLQTALFQSGSWGSKTLASGVVPVSSFPVIAMNSTGNACMAWYSFDRTSQTRSLYVNTFSLLGGWGTPTKLSTTNRTVRDNYKVSIDSTDLITVTWEELTSLPFLFVATSTFGGGWTTTQLSP